MERKGFIKALGLGTVSAAIPTVNQNIYALSKSEKKYIFNLRNRNREEINKKISIAKTGKKHTEETKKKMSEARLGKTLSQEVKEKIRKGNKGKVVSDKTKEKLRAVNLGRKHSEQTKLKQSLSKKGKPSNRKGFKHSQEAKFKISASLAKLQRGRPVLQIDSNGTIVAEFKNIVTAQRHTGIYPNCCLIGRNKSAGGFIWKYKNV